MDERASQRLIEQVASAHRVLDTHLVAVAGSDEADASAPSTLAGWTRGHVLTHVARNADGLRRILEGVELGEQRDQYVGGLAGRQTDIAVGAPRPWPEQVADVTAANAAFDKRASAQVRWDGNGVTSGGEVVAAPELLFRRLREVVIHHADLGLAGYRPSEWPLEYVREELRRQTMSWNARAPMGIGGLPAEVMARDELDRLVWLLGRADIEGLEPADIF